MYIHLLSFSFSPTVQFLFRFFRLFTGTSLLFLSLKITCLAQSVKAINKSTGSKYFASNPFIRSFMNQKMSTVLSPSSDTTFNSKLESLHFDNRNLRNLPVDTGSGNISRATPNVIFSTVKLQPVKNPKLICISPDALRLLGLPYKEQNMLSEEEVAKIERYLSGNELIPGSELAAHCYCGKPYV